MCGRNDKLRRAAAVWEAGSFDGDGTNETIVVNGGVSSGSGTIGSDIPFRGQGQWVGGSASTGRSHYHQETGAAQKCRPPVLEHSPRVVFGFLRLVLGTIALIEFVRLGFSLHELGFQLGQLRFGHVGANAGVTLSLIGAQSLRAIGCGISAVFIQRSLMKLRYKERAAFAAAYESWEQLYYCERDGWLGIAS